VMPTYSQRQPMTHKRHALTISALWLRGFDEVLAEKRNYFRVEILMEANAVEARNIDANSRKVLHFLRQTSRKEREVNSIWCKMVVGFRWQPKIDPNSAAS
jgi:hypothetical protein